MDQWRVVGNVCMNELDLVGIQLQLSIDKADRHMRTAVHDVAQDSCLFAQRTGLVC